MTATLAYPESFPSSHEKRERSKLGLILTGIGLGVAACGIGLASLDNLQGRRRWLPRPIDAGFIDDSAENEQATLFMPGFDCGDVDKIAKRLSSYLQEFGPVGFVNDNTGAHSIEQTRQDVFNFVEKSNITQVNFVGLSAGGMSAMDIAGTLNERGVGTNIVMVGSPASIMDLYPGQRAALKVAANFYKRMHLSLGPNTRLIYELLRTAHQEGVNTRTWGLARARVDGDGVTPNVHIFHKADYICNYDITASAGQLSPQTQIAEIYDDNPGGDGTVKNQLAVTRRKAALGARNHFQLPVNGIGHVDFDTTSRIELYGQALRETFRLMGVCAVGAVVQLPEAALSSSVELIEPAKIVA